MFETSQFKLRLVEVFLRPSPLPILLHTTATDEMVALHTGNIGVVKHPRRRLLPHAVRHITNLTRRLLVSLIFFVVRHFWTYFLV